MDKADIEAIKEANPILDVLRDLGVPAQNNRIRCLKPENHAHGDRTPSVSIWPDRGQFKCWVCADVKGDVIDLVRLARGCTFREALEFLGRNSLGTAALPPLRPSRPATTPSRRETSPDPSVRAAASTAGNPSSPPQAFPGPLPPQHPHAHHGPDFREEGLAEPALDLIASDPRSAEPARIIQAADYRTTTEKGLEDELLRLRILQALIEACSPVSGKVGQYLQKRRIFKRTWDAQGLRMIDDYAGLSRKLEAAFGFADLERTGFFNAAGHLRYYRHKLLFPYYDPQGRPVYMQARAIDAEAKPKELSMSGHIPLPYNCRLLNGEPGQIYLCEGVIDTLTLLEQGFPSVGVPGAANFKPAWADLFRNKTVHVAFDPDAPGESGAAKTIERLQAHGIEARRLAPPTGMDLNDWFRKG
ncbi:MAG: toprim domain-containing protein [Fibrobacteria bacterium]